MSERAWGKGAPPAGRNVVAVFPNAITLMALCSGLSSVHMALRGEFSTAIALILLAAFFDAMDGGVARILKASSNLGAQLDSLSDCVAFGAAPALVMFIWGLEGQRFGWSAVVVFSACMALRLARFNSLLGTPDPRPFAKHFFTGVPAPAGAGTLLLPVLASEVVGTGWWSEPWFLLAWCVASGLLLVSRFPTLSLKGLRIPMPLVPFILVLVVLVAALAVANPMGVVLVLMAGYVLTIPLSGMLYLVMSRNPERWPGPDEPAEEDPEDYPSLPAARHGAVHEEIAAEGGGSRGGGFRRRLATAPRPRFVSSRSVGSSRRFTRRRRRRQP